MKKLIAAPAIAGALVLSAASIADAGLAQNAQTTPPAGATTTDDGGDDDDGGNAGLWGLLGLAGLAGLAGLRRRDRGVADRRYDGGATSVGRP